MKKIIQKFLQKTEFGDHAEKIIFAPVPKNTPGDLAMNVFPLAKILKKSPPEILKKLAKTLETCPELEKIELAGQYLNLFFRNEPFFREVFATPAEISTLAGKKILIEFSAPNTNKPLHLGHMRNHALGIAVAKILEKSGARVFRVNMINDRGVHICKSMLAYQKFGKNALPDEKSDHFVGKFYTKFETESKKNPKLSDEVQKMLQKWESGDSETRKLWQKMNEWTLAGHAETYRRQGIKFLKNYLESETYQLGKKIAETALADGIFRKNSDGAIVFDFEEKGKIREKIVLRADGTSIYLTNDLGNTKLKFEDFRPDEMIWVVADEQNEHFRILFAVLEKLKILDRSHLTHLAYGLVNLPDGRMKSREGNVVDADNLMDELHEIAAEKIRENSNCSSRDEAEEDLNRKIERTAEQIQNAAWKFYLLRTSPRKTITFDAQKSIDFHGATGPYLQYAGVRIRSILKKSGGNESDFEKLQPSPDSITTLGKPEKPLGVKILEFPAVLARAAETRNPTFVATFLMELAQIWSSFYAENSILNAKNENLKSARLALARKTFEILESGLDCLGIEIPEKM